MKRTYVRSAEPKDAQMYFDWLKEASDRNMVDTGVYSYPTCMTFTVEKVDEDGAEPLLMNSIHAVTMLEALAPKPGLSPMDEARALKKLLDAVKLIAANNHVREIWFTCEDESLNDFVEGRGFKKVTSPMYKLVLSEADVAELTKSE